MNHSPPPKPADRTLRLAGLAFAAGDLLFEADAEGRIVFAVGAAQSLTGQTDGQLVGTGIGELLAPADAAVAEGLLAAALPGEREGPVRVELRHHAQGAPVRFALFSVFKLPELAPNISCVLTLAPPALAPALRDEDGLVAPQAFPHLAAQILTEADRNGQTLNLDLVEIQGLKAETESLAPQAGDAARRRIASVLRAESYGGVGVAEVAQDRFAVIREADWPMERLTEQIAAAAAAAKLGVKAATARLPLEAGTPEQNMRALRYALDRYIDEGVSAAATSFKATVQQTARDSARFKAIVATGDFLIAYQPVVALADESVHHYEALARFDEGASPGDTIRLAEELDMIRDFDLTVVSAVAKVLTEADPGISVAVNISTRSLMEPSFAGALLQTTAANPGLRRRMLLEITETVAIADLEAADLVLQGLRKSGHRICIDDFGSGAASLEYLRHLQVDFLKIDGRYVKDLQAGGRDAVLVKHLVALCRDLGIATIAEMVETPEIARMVKDIGVAYGQGWAFGKPLASPKRPAPQLRPARRRGATEEWL